VSGRDKIRETDGGGEAKQRRRRGASEERAWKAHRLKKKDAVGTRCKRSTWVKVLERRGGQ
jgi:hypothetical protein